MNPAQEREIFKRMDLLARQLEATQRMQRRILSLLERTDPEARIATRLLGTYQQAVGSDQS